MNDQERAQINKSEKIDHKSISKSLSQSIKDLQLASYRWAILFLYYLVVLVNGVPYEICVPITIDLAAIYNTSTGMVTTASTVFMFMHPLLSFVAAQAIAKYGWASATNFGVLLTVLGCAIKLLTNKLGFFIVIIGQVICGIGRPFILNSQASMAMSWFHPKSRILIITALNVVNTLSLVVSAQLPGIIFKTYDELTDRVKDHEDGLERMNKLIWLEFFISLSIIPCFILLRSRPKEVPVKIHKIEKKRGMIKIMLRLFKNTNFVLLFIPFSLFFGILKSFLVVMELLLKPYGYSVTTVSGVVSIPLFGGLAAQGFFPYFVNKYKLHKGFVRLFLILSTISLGTLFFAIRSQTPALVYINITFLASFVMPVLPVIMDLSCDLISPIEPSFAVGALYMGSMLFFTAYTYILNFIVGEDADGFQIFLAHAISTGLLFLGFFCSLFVRLDHYEPLSVESERHSLVTPLEKGPSMMRGTQSKMSINYRKSSLFNCSVNNIGIVGDAPIIAGEEAEDIIDEVPQD